MKECSSMQHDQGTETNVNKESSDTPANSARAYAFLARMFRNQLNDPLCGKCKALVNSAASVREKLACFTAGADAGALSEEYGHLLTEAKKLLEGLDLPESASGQKKAGNCHLPQGVCFVKNSKAILDRI